MSTTTTLLTADQAAQRLHCSVYTVYRELAAGNLRGSKPLKVWLIPEAAIDEYLAQHSNEPKTETTRRRRRRKW